MRTLQKLLSLVLSFLHKCIALYGRWHVSQSSKPPPWVIHFSWVSPIYTRVFIDVWSSLVSLLLQGSQLGTQKGREKVIFPPLYPLFILSSCTNALLLDSLIITLFLIQPCTTLSLIWRPLHQASPPPGILFLCFLPNYLMSLPFHWKLCPGPPRLD